MTYTVYLKRSAEKELDHLPEKIHDRIVNILLSLKENHIPKGVKKLKGRDGYRIRVGDFRILYIIDYSKKRIDIISIAHRREVYRLT
jgi:mRNA interferase RelE/StbE